MVGFVAPTTRACLCSSLQCSITVFSVPSGGKITASPGSKLPAELPRCLPLAAVPSRKEGRSTKSLGIGKNFSQKNQGGSRLEGKEKKKKKGKINLLATSRSCLKLPAAHATQGDHGQKQALTQAALWLL